MSQNEPSENREVALVLILGSIVVIGILGVVLVGFHF